MTSRPSPFSERPDTDKPDIERPDIERPDIRREIGDSHEDPPRMRVSLPLRTCAVGLIGMALLGGCRREVAPTPMLAASRSMAVAATPTQSDRRIAYAHSFVLELPSASVQATQQKDLADCLAAGCTVLATHVSSLRNGVVQGSISVRIAPDRYAAFATALTTSPARLVSHTETAEDKTVPLLDLDKRLAAQTTLRDRLTQMLTQAGTSVADLVAVEKQLADVQGTIESETAQRDYLRTLTDTVNVDVAYNGLIQQAGPLDISPIRAALDNFGRTVIQSFGEMIDWIAFALPWLPLGLLAAWLLRRLVRRRSP